MSTTFIRDGRLVGSPFASLPHGYDLNRLTTAQINGVSAVLGKSRSGGGMTADDMSVLMVARKAARTTGGQRNADTLEELTSLVRRLKKLGS